MDLFAKDKRHKKKRLTKVIFVILLLAALSLIYFFNHKFANNTGPVIRKGKLNLIQWDWQKDGIISLSGDWELYVDKLITPQDFREAPLPQKDLFFSVPAKINKYSLLTKDLTNTDYFTYRTQIRLPQNTDKKLALKFPLTIGTALKVWINGQKIDLVGKLSRNKSELKPGWGSKVVDFNVEQSQLNIIIQASNYYNQSGLMGEIFLGPEEKIRTSEKKSIAFDMFLFGSLLIMAFYHLGLFVFRPEDTAPLYFSLFCLIINLRMAVVGEAFLVDYFNWSYSISYKMLLSYYLAVPLFCLFIASLYAKEFSQKVLISSQVLGVSFYTFVLISPLEISSYTLPYEIITLFFAAYCLYIIILVLLKERTGALLFLASFFFLFLFVLNDIFYSNGIINTGYYFHLGLFIFLFFQSIMLARRFMRSFSIIESMSEKLQEKNNMLTKINKFKDEFVTNTSQELKLPINNIISAAESIIHSGTSVLSESMRKDLTSIINTGEGLNYILNSFIDYSKIKEGTIKLNEKRLELNKIIEYIIDFFTPFIDDKDISFTNQIKGKNYIIEADKSRIIQILYNLLDDLTATIDKGEISFLAAEKSAGEVELSLEVKADNIIFQYQTNSAKSIEERDIFKGKINIKQIVTRELIELQGGELNINKSSNKQLIVKITLPGKISKDIKEKSSTDKNGKEKNNSLEKEIKAKQNEKRIVIIGNKSSQFEFLEEVLEKEDYILESLANRNEVLKSLDDHSLLVILNLFTFNKSDIKFCEKIRERFTVFELPILVMAARSKPQNLIDGFEVGINEFIRKPFVVSELKARVKTLITLKKQVEESFKREQDFLRAQIKPHFLYNTLDTIAYLCNDDPEQASDLIMDLAQYLRYSFDFESLSQTVPIDQELELVEFYLTIQQARFKDRINIEYELDKNLEFDLPPLAVQTLIENATKHGILKQESGGTIKLVIREEDEYYKIKIIDNGVGMRVEEIDKLFVGENKERRSVGLKNINKRLRKLYNQELVINSKLNEGTTVKFVIPKDRA